MKYDITRAKTGDILICQGNSKTSETIQMMTDSVNSHSAVILIIGGVTCVFDAQIEGCYPMEINNWLNKFGYNFHVYRRKGIVNYSQYLSNCCHYFGVKYDLKHLGIGLVLSKLGFKNMAEKYRSNGRFICSELTARLEHIENPEDFSPEKLDFYFGSTKSNEYDYLGEFKYEKK